MIFTLTPNPSIDRTLGIPEIQFNNVLRCERVRLDWGGKGFNVSRALQTFGVESLALAWVGGGAGKMLADGLQRMGVQTDFVWVDEETRTNTIILEQGSSWHIKVNEPGPPISSQDIEQLINKVEGYAKKDDIWVLSGSLPPDVPDDFYATLVRLIKSRGGLVYLDARGNPLKEGCKASPFLVKPNAEEASHIAGFPINDQEDAKRAALPFLRMGIDYFALTLGQSGLLMASQEEMVFAVPPKVETRNAAGAGDSLMAGLIYAQQKSLPLVEIAQWAVAAGSASVLTEGVAEFDIDQIMQILPEVDSRVINIM